MENSSVWKVMIKRFVEDEHSKRKAVIYAYFAYGYDKMVEKFAEIEKYFLELRAVEKKRQ